MSFLQFLIDDMCANFTVEAMSELVKKRLKQGSCSLGDLALEIVGTDHTLDIKSAQILAQAALESLIEQGDVIIEGTSISLRRPDSVR